MLRVLEFQEGKICDWVGFLLIFYDEFRLMMIFGAGFEWVGMGALGDGILYREVVSPA
jgi:hypothetical protein